MSGINRRQLLAGGLAAMASAALPWWQRLALAQDGPRERNLLMVFVAGGWDVTASVDPKPGLTTIDSPPGDVRLFRNTPVLVGDDRPAVAQFFESWGDSCAVVNGIEVRSIAHEECTKRILTGSSRDAQPDIGAITGAERGASLAVPYMILGNTAFAGAFGGATGRAGVVGQLTTLLDPNYTYSAFFGRNTPRFKPTGGEADLIRRRLIRRAEGHRAAAAAESLNKRRLEDFIASLERRDLLRPLLDTENEDLAFQLEFAPQVDLALRLFKDGLSRAVLIEHSGQWDSHANNNALQLPLHQDLYGNLNALMERLVREDLFESTVVVVMSEMARTPKLNGERGKDHWPVTSALVIGSDIRGGQVYGGTDAFQNSVKVNLATGKPDETARGGVTAASFASGVLTLMGVDTQPYFPGVDPLRGFLPG